MTELGIVAGLTRRRMPVGVRAPRARGRGAGRTRLTGDATTGGDTRRPPSAR
jgi:hypothetical protein